MNKINKNKERDRGFTLLEILVAIAVMSVIGVVTTAMLFSALSWRDKLLAMEQVEESNRVIRRMMERAVGEAEEIEVENNTLRTSKTGECWSFSWQDVTEELTYSHDQTVDCVPEVDPAGELLPQVVRVRDFEIKMRELSSEGKEVYWKMEISVTRPLGSYETEFEQTVINFVDEG